MHVAVILDDVISIANNMAELIKLVRCVFQTIGRTCFNNR